MSAVTVEPDVLLIREYLRVSFDESGRERSNDEQHGDNVAAVDREPLWRMSDLPAYRDVGSASKFARKRRDGYHELTADLAADRFGADAVQIWESSRGSRKVGEWVTLLELCAEKSVRILVTTHGPRMYDPTNDRDWRTLMEDAVDGEYESRKTSKRTRRSMAASAEAGKVPGGRRAFGYSRDGRSLDHVEAEVVRECVRRVLAGESIRRIAGNLNERGVRTSAGNAWHPGSLRAMLAGTRIAGLRTYKGRVVAKGEWPAIVDEVTHRRLVAVLAAKSSTPTRGRTPWVLSGLLRCAHCGEALIGNTDTWGSSGRRYICRKAPGYKGCGGLGIKAEPVEELLGKLVTERLADVDARRQADTGPDDADELAELNRLAAMRIELADDRIAGRISREQSLEDGAALSRRQQEIEQRLALKVRDNAPLDFIAAEGYVGRQWSELDIGEQRVVLDALIDHVTVGPATVRGSTRFEAARITAPGRIVWRV